MNLCINSSIHLLINSPFLPSVRLFVCSCIYSLINAFIHSFTRSAAGGTLFAVVNSHPVGVCVCECKSRARLRVTELPLRSAVPVEEWFPLEASGRWAVLWPLVKIQ